MNIDFLRPYCVDSKIRVGRIYDGGYVLENKSLDDFEILYGYGVGWDVSFEKALHNRPKNPVGYLIQPCLMLETFQPLARGVCSRF